MRTTQFEEKTLSVSFNHHHHLNPCECARLRKRADLIPSDPPVTIAQLPAIVDPSGLFAALFRSATPPSPCSVPCSLPDLTDSSQVYYYGGTESHWVMVMRVGVHGAILMNQEPSPLLCEMNKVFEETDVFATCNEPYEDGHRSSARDSSLDHSQ